MKGKFSSLLWVLVALFATSFQASAQDDLYYNPSTDAAAKKNSADYNDEYSDNRRYEDVLSDYWFVPVALLVSLAYYFVKKSWLKAVLTALYPVVFVFAVNVPYHESTHQFYMENLWLPLGLFAAMPLVFDVLPGWQGEKKTVLITALVVLAGTIRIAAAHDD